MVKLLLDSHILLAIARGDLEAIYPTAHSAISRDGVEKFASVASFWELSIKVRIGKLDLGMSADEFAAYIGSFGILIIPISVEHATASITPEPTTRDPFDRMLLAQCKVEGLQLVTIDRALVSHPYALTAT